MYWSPAKAPRAADCFTKLALIASYPSQETFTAAFSKAVSHYAANRYG
jgi:hypothetical protein